MKIIIVSISVITIALMGCRSNSKDLISKKWRITDITMPGQILPDSIKQKVTQGSMEFTKNGKLVLTGINAGGDNTATYTLSDDGKTLTVVANGQTQTNDVRELSKSKLSLHDQNSGSTITAVPK